MLAVLSLLVAGVTAFFVFHHPPMRLMPAPLLFQDDGSGLTGVGAALAVDSRIEVFYATSRLPAGPREARIYTVAPDRRLHLGLATLRIGEAGSTLDQLREWSTGANGERPFIRLERMREDASLPADGMPAPEAAVWLAAIDAELAASRSRDIIVYVHGANTTVERAAGQAAQLRHFAGRQAVVVLFAWPTAENFLRYPRDIEAAFGAAPHLADLIELLAERTEAERIGVFTYSAGATVGSDGLALLGRDRPEVAARLGEVYHAAPDADFRGFVDDLAAYAAAARRVTTAVNLGDSALRLAGAVNRASRAGRPDLRELDPEAAARLLAAADAEEIEVLQVHPENMPGLSATSHTFWYDDPWVSNDLLLTMLFHLTPEARRLEPGTAQPGGRYWTFPPDYPARMAAARGELLAGR
jgi:esterase/lipase superfamily enzyme